MNIRKCRACGANLPDAAGALTIECPYCHAVNELPTRAAPRRPATHPGHDDEPATTGSKVVFYLFLAFLAVSMCLGVGVTIVSAALVPVTASTVVSASNAEARYVPTFSDRAHLDPVRELSQVLEQARVWRSDAVPYGLSATGIRADGTTDVSPNGDPANKVQWNFFSAGAFAAREVATSGEYVLTISVSPTVDRSTPGDWGVPHQVQTYPDLLCGVRDLVKHARATTPTLDGGASWDITWAAPGTFQVRRSGWDVAAGAFFDPMSCRPD